jgi:hypothetical protein
MKLYQFTDGTAMKKSTVGAICIQGKESTY